MKNVREHFIRVYKVLWQLLCKLKILFYRTYEGDQNIFSKKFFFLDEKQFWLVFSRITEYGRPQATVRYAPQGFITVIVQVIISFFITPKRLLKTQIFEKKDYFPSKKKVLRQNFSRIIEFKKPQGTCFRSLQGFMTVIMQVIRSFL